MSYLRSRQRVSSISFCLTLTHKIRLQAVVLAVFFAVVPCLAQDPAHDNPTQSTGQPASPQTAIIPAGTRIALVLTHPIQSRRVHRGDDIYAQTSSPVNSGNQVLIPAGTSVQAKVEKLDWNGGRAKLILQSMSITFPDGHVAPVSGPLTLESDDGYALKDPGKGRIVSAIALPAAGAGLGALIGHAAGSSQSSLTSTLPPGCVAGSPFCLSSTTPVSTKGRDAAIGAVVGVAIAAVASMALLLSSHHFFLDVWSPVEMIVEQPIRLSEGQVRNAVRQEEENPAPPLPIAQPPLPPPPPDDHGICYSPDTPGTPPTVIPGPLGPDGILGPPTIIPGTPPIPGSPHPCP
jgi:hypothetical protein